ncbi:MAG: ATP-binding cassette domain-containing protein [Bacillota bacterium]
MPSIILDNVWHCYSRGTPLETVSLSGVSLSIGEGDFLALVGPTGSGKSTLLQLLNGLLLPDRGRVLVEGKNTRDKSTRKNLWSLVGLVMQYPERQFFEETVYREISFGPRNLGLGEMEIFERVSEALDMVGLDRDAVRDVSPYALSGGEKRRVALASILAIKPRVLALDEPTAGVDAAGRRRICQTLKRLKSDQGVTVVMSSHNMDDVALLADRVAVLKEGGIVLEGDTRQVFSNFRIIEEAGLELPFPCRVDCSLKEAGFEVEGRPLDFEEVVEGILKRLAGKKSRKADFRA